MLLMLLRNAVDNRMVMKREGKNNRKKELLPDAIPWLLSQRAVSLKERRLPQ